MDCAYQVHTAIGPGLLESAYEECLAYELLERGLTVSRQRAVPLVYKRLTLDVAYRLDLFVEDCVVVEVKAVDTLASVHDAQVATYLRLTECRLGYLINFNVPHLKNGLRRIVR